MSKKSKDDEVEKLQPLPDGPTLERLLKDYWVNNAEVREATGKIGSLVKNGEEVFNVHRKAFKLTAQLEKMDDSKRSEYLTHLFHYLGLRGLGPDPDLFAEERAKDLAKMASKDAATLAKADKNLAPVN